MHKFSNSIHQTNEIHFMMTANDPFPGKVAGYPKLAAKIEVQPEVGIFRRFGFLNAQNLLYFQAELAYLEEKLVKQQEQDALSGVGKAQSFAKNWYWLKVSRETSDTKQLDLVLQIRAILEKYNQALIQQSTISNLPEPDKWDLRHLQDYLQTPAMGRQILSGPDSTIWGSVHLRTDHKPDLITLRARPKEDPFTVWAAENTIFGLLKYKITGILKPSPVHGLVGYEDSTIHRITYWFTGIVASLIPIASILVLYSVKSMPARLAIIASFNVLVSACLMGLTSAKRTDVFAITAAFSAVQVVFVGTDKSNP